MANFTFSNYVKGSNSSNYFGLYGEGFYSQSVSGNYTDITVNLYIRYYSIDMWVDKSGAITINGTSTSFTKAAWSDYPSGGGGKALLGTAKTRVYHNSDGKKTNVPISASWTPEITYAGTYYSTLTASTTVDLPTIPRSSSFTLSASSLAVGDQITVSISRASSSFTHTVEFYINSSYYQKYTGVATSKSFQIPTSWYSAMPSSSSCTAYCRVTTYNGNAQIGDQVSKSFIVSVPSNIIPTVGTITIDPVNINSQNILVQNKNRFSVSVSECSAGTGSSIKSYTFSGPGISSTTTSTSVSGGPVSGSGTLTYTVKVTDNRGRSASKSATITCYAYVAPYFKSFSAYRANSSGSIDNNGSYIKCAYEIAYSSVNSTNSPTVKIYGGPSVVTATNGSALINLNGNTTSAYKIYATVSDSYSGSATSNTVTIFGASRIINAANDGLGVAVGKMSERTSSNPNGLFECAFDAKFYRNITINDKTLLDWTHPVGSIYQSTVSTSPAKLFGGTWEEITGRFLFSRTSDIAAGSTGGEATHTLTIDEIPSHGHNLNGSKILLTTNSKAVQETAVAEGVQNVAGFKTATAEGNGRAHNNMPPYLAVYTWKRTK